MSTSHPPVALRRSKQKSPGAATQGDLVISLTEIGYAKTTQPQALYLLCP